MWEAFEHAGHESLDNLIAILDINRLGQRGETMDGWNTAAYARAWRRSAGARSRSTATTSRRSTRRTTRRSPANGQPVAIVARTLKGKGVAAVENKDGWHGKPLADPEAAIAELGGERNIRRRRRQARGRRPRCTRSTTPGAPLPTWQVGEKMATRKAYGEALAAVGADRRQGRRARRRGLQLDLRRDLQGRPSGPLLRACGSPSSSWSRPRSGCRCAAGSRSPRRSRRSSRARTTSSAWRAISPGATSASSGRTPASRSARTGRRRWRSRISRRSARCTASTVLYPSDPNQTAQLVEQMADQGRDRLHADDPRGAAGAVRAGRASSRSAARASCAPPTTTRSRSSRRGSRCTRRSPRPTSWPTRTWPSGSSTSTRSSRSTRRRCEAAAEATGVIVTVEDHWAEGGIGDTVLGALADSEQRPRVVKLAVTRDARIRHAGRAAARREDRQGGDRRGGPLRRCAPEPDRLKVGAPCRRTASSSRWLFSRGSC